MAEDSGEKTEEATPKKRSDARKKGEVARSKDLTETFILILWLVAGLGTAGLTLRWIAALFDMAFEAIGQPFGHAAGAMAWQSGYDLLVLSALFILPAMIGAIAADLLQIGPLIQFEKMKPKFESMNPVEGFKRMFGKDNLIELGKQLFKTAVIVTVTVVVGMNVMRSLPQLVFAQPSDLLGAFGWIVFRLGAWVAGTFAFLSAADLLWQRSKHGKKLRMSQRDIRREQKEDAGDPQLRSRRRELHAEFAQQDPVEAAGQATMIVANPIHLAIAICYDPATAAAPIVSAKGAGPIARAMRGAARTAGVPIVRHVELARALNARVEVDDMIPPDLFTAVAEVLIWAQKIKDAVV